MKRVGILIAMYLLTVSAAVLGRAGEPSPEATGDKPVRAVARSIVADPCPVIRAAFGTEHTSCSRFRDVRGTFRIHATLHAAGKKTEILRPGKTCDGGYLGVPGSKGPAKFIGYLDVDFSLSDDGAELEFGGNQIEWIPPCHGRRCGTIGKACDDVAGQLRLRDGIWRRPEDLRGCTETPEKPR